MSTGIEFDADPMVSARSAECRGLAAFLIEVIELGI